MRLRSAVLFLIVMGFLQAFARTAAAQDNPIPTGAIHRFGHLRWRHSTGVYFVAIMPDNKAILTASQDHVFRLWDTATGKEIRRFESSSVSKAFTAHPFKFYRGFGPEDSGKSCVSVSLDGKTLAAALPNGVIQLWDIKTGKETHRFKTADALIYSIRFSPSGALLAVRSGGQDISFYDLDTEKVRPATRYAKDGLVYPGANAGMAFSPDGKILANGKVGFDQVKNFTFIQLVNVKTGEEIRRFDTSDKCPAGIAFAPDGKVLAYSRLDLIHLIETDTGKEIGKIKAPEMISAVAFSSDGKYLIAKALDRAVRVWNPLSGKLLQEWGDKVAFVEERPHGASEECDLAVSADGKIIAWGDGQTVRIFDAVTGRDLASPTGPCAAVTAIGIASDCKTLVSYGEDDTFRRWDLRSGKPIGHLRVPAGAMFAAFAPDAQTAALANADGTIRVIELGTGKEHRQLKGHTRPDPDRFNDTVDLVYSPNGKILASQGSFDATIRLHDPLRGGELRQNLFGDTAGVRLFRPEFVVRGGLGLAFSADGQTVAACESHMPGRSPFGEEGWHTAKLRQWDIATGKELRPFTLTARRLITEIAFSPDGRLLAAVHTDQTVSLFETATGRERAVMGKPQLSQLVSAWIYQRRYEPAPTRTLAFSPDSRRLLSRSPLDVVRVWDVHAAQEIGQLKGHDGPVLVAAFTPDSRSIITGGNDTTILIWDARRMKPKPIPPVILEANDIDSLWADLLDDDSAKAFASMQKLVSAAKQSVPYLRRKVEPAKIDSKRIDRLIADLDNENFLRRTQAVRDLDEIGGVAVPSLKIAYAAAISPEARRRIEPLLEKLTPTALSRADVRLVRVIEILEQAGNAEARQVLEALATGSPGALATLQAKSALDRLVIANLCPARP